MDWIENHGIKCWIAPRDIPPAAEWNDAIVEGVSLCKKNVLIVQDMLNEKFDRQTNRVK